MAEMVTADVDEDVLGGVVGHADPDAVRAPVTKSCADILPGIQRNSNAIMGKSSSTLFCFILSYLFLSLSFEKIVSSC